MESNLHSESFNPYAAPAPTTERLSAVSVTRASVQFSGRVEERQLRNFYNEPLHFGCLLTLLLISGAVWTIAMGVAFGGYAGMFVALCTAMVSFWVGVLFLSDWRFQQCLRLRPWLVGECRGHVSTGRMTAWHNDVCVQTIDHSLFDLMKRGCLQFSYRRYPLTWVPSLCFFEEQWRDLTMELRQTVRMLPLVIEAPSPNAHQCMVPLYRLGFLRDRAIGIHSRASANMIWLTAVISTILFLVFPMQSMLGGWGLIAFALGMWVVLELGRVGWCRWSLRSQFGGQPTMAYRDADKSACSQHPYFLLHSWFDSDTVLANEGSFWIRIPMRRVDRIRIDDAGIEFLVGSLKLFFHREGFGGPEAWEHACQAARLIRLVPSSSTLSIPG
jgi:hypothetical protein